MELKDSISNWVEAVVMSLKSPSLNATLAAFDPSDDEKDVRD